MSQNIQLADMSMKSKIYFVMPVILGILTKEILFVCQTNLTSDKQMESTIPSDKLSIQYTPD